MKIHILTHSLGEEHWLALRKNKEHQLVDHQGESLVNVLKTVSPEDFLYWETPNLEPELKKGLRLLEKRADVAWGILDPQGLVFDPGELFFMGAWDYQGPLFFNKPLALARFTRMVHWSSPEQEEASEPTGAFDWAQAVPGQEYPFMFLLVTLAKSGEMKKRLGDKRFHQLQIDFKTWLSWAAQEEGGLLWMDMDTSFLILFPDNLSSKGLIFGFKTLLSRLHLGFEYFRLDKPLDLVLAAHRGQAPWQVPGQTGTVVSDGINSVFHLGQKFAPENTLTITEPCLPSVPENLKNLVVPQGTYEGRQTFRFLKAQFQP